MALSHRNNCLSQVFLRQVWSFGRIRAVIADADVQSHDDLRSLVEHEADIDLVGDAADGLAAVDAILKHSPDLVVLDVHLPKIDGFEVIQAISDDPIPSVVFVATDERDAVRAFAAGVLDYLLKPLDASRVRIAFGRARQFVENRRSDLLYRDLLTFVRDLRRDQRPVCRFTIRANGRLLVVRAADIDWIEAVGSQVRLHAGAESHLLHETLSGMEARLDRNLFLRIHRSHIVNVERIRELHPWHSGESVVILPAGVQLPVSRRCRDALYERFGKSL